MSYKYKESKAKMTRREGGVGMCEAWCIYVQRIKKIISLDFGLALMDMVFYRHGSKECFKGLKYLYIYFFYFKTVNFGCTSHCECKKWSEIVCLFRFCFNYNSFFSIPSSVYWITYKLVDQRCRQHLFFKNGL